MYVAMSCPNIFLSSYAQSFGLFLDDQQVLHCIGQFNNLICLQSENLAILPYYCWIMELLIYGHTNSEHQALFYFRFSDIFIQEGHRILKRNKSNKKDYIEFRYIL